MKYDIAFRTERVEKNAAILDLWTAYKEELGKCGLDNSNKLSPLYSYAVFFVNGELASVMFYIPMNWDKEIRIVGAYTKPTWRRRGLYTALWNVMVDMWIQWGEFDKVISGYHKDNEISAEMQRARGSKVTGPNKDHISTSYNLRSPWHKHRPMDVERLEEISKALERSESTTWLTRFWKMLS